MPDVGSPTSFTERAFYESGRYDGSIAERRAIVAWHRRNLYRPDHWTGEDYADAIESGEHLAGDDE